MLKILIADDEPLVRAGIKSVIPWQQHGFEVIGEAENGLEAYNKIISLKPDILITDIKMPQMDGIELLKKIKKDKIHIQSIILSCFDEFDMVREAMKYGAKDYILKLSIEPQKILDVLDEIKQNMAVDEPQSDQIVLDDSDIKYLFIRKLINHGFTSEEQVNNVIHNIHFSASLNHYKLTMFCITKNDMAQLGSDDNKLLYNLLDQICQRFKGHELILIKTNRYLLVQNDENNEFLYRQISASINQFANGTVLFGQVLSLIHIRILVLHSSRLFLHSKHVCFTRKTLFCHMNKFSIIQYCKLVVKMKKLYILPYHLEMRTNQSMK